MQGDTTTTIATIATTATTATTATIATISTIATIATTILLRTDQPSLPRFLSKFPPSPPTVHPSCSVPSPSTEKHIASGRWATG